MIAVRSVFTVSAAALCLGLLPDRPMAAASDAIIVQSTTSSKNSGLYDHLLPLFKKATGITVHIVAVGTGQAIRLGEAGDVDAILVHSRKAEDAFVAGGYGTHRREIMYNDFVLIGPKDDPAGVIGSSDAAAALTRIAEAEAPFASRGDDSGTHRREQSLWTAAGIDVSGAGKPWYRAAGAGMGATLNVAAGMNAYVMSDRASWLNFRNKGDLTIVFQGDPILFNQYAFLPVNPARHPHVKIDLANALEAWLAGDKAQALIGAYEIAGEKLFTPNAKPE